MQHTSINFVADGTESFLKDQNKDVPTTPEMRGVSAELASISHRPRYARIWLFLIFMTTFNFCSNYISSETTQLKTFYVDKLGWSETSVTKKWSNIATVKFVGACIGSFSAGGILNFGRRRALFFVAIIFFLAACLSEYMNMAALYFFRLIAGIGLGLNAVTVNRFIEEFVPLSMFSTAAPFNIFMGQFGVFFAQMSAYFLPHYGSDSLVVQESTSWRYIFGFAFVVLALGLLGLLLVVRYDSPKFYLLKGNEDRAVKAIHTIYDTEGSQIQANKIMRFI